MGMRNRTEIAITLAWPTEFKIIRSGERVVAASGPDEVTVEFREDRVAGDSWVAEIGSLFDEFEDSRWRELSKTRRALRRRGQNTTARQDEPNKDGEPEAR